MLALVITWYDLFCFPNEFPDVFFDLKWFTVQISKVLVIGLSPFTLIVFWFIHKSSTSTLFTSNHGVTDIDACIIVKNSQRGSNIKIKISDILYMKSDRNYLEINYLENSIEKIAVHRSSLSAMIDKLPKDLFCRIHNSYIASRSLMSAPYTVNSTYVVRLNSSKGVLLLPVSRTYLKAVREAFTTTTT